ncbi:MAG: hypothetical protein QXP31_08000 [Pyrobaculum sp.]
MEKKDCLFALVECGKGGLNPLELLRQARIKSRKLVILGNCGDTAAMLTTVRAIASENMDFPIRFYQGVGVDEAARLERCQSYELINS